MLGETNLPCTMEELIAVHRKQKKELQSQIQAVKKSVPKGDKARLKQAQKKIKEMEGELAAMQEQEINSFTTQEQDTNDVSAKINNLDLNNSLKTERPTKMSKAQKLREKKEAKAKELNARLAQAESEYTSTERYIEESKINEKLNLLGLKVKQISSDGNCLFSAIKHQIDDNQSVNDLRIKTASYIREHKNDYLPFLISNNTKSVMTEEEFESYCLDIEKPSTWGGQIELIALSHVLKSPIHVIQADADTTIHGEEYNNSNPIILTFYKLQLGLGEHYNSITKSLEIK